MVLARYGSFLVACFSLVPQICPLQYCTPKYPYAKYPCLDARANARTCSLLCPLFFWFSPLAVLAQKHISIEGRPTHSMASQVRIRIISLFSPIDITIDIPTTALPSLQLLPLCIFSLLLPIITVNLN